MTQIDVICFGGEDWWYHNRGHIDIQLMRRFGRLGTTLYVNSIVMQKANLTQGRRFIRKAIRKAKSIFTGLKKTDAGFWVFSPFSLPVHHISWLSRFNEIILRFQLRAVMRKLKIYSPVLWVACPAACNIAIELEKSTLVYQRTDRYEEYPNVSGNVIKEYDQKLKMSADLTVFVSYKLYEQEQSQCRRAFLLDHGVDYDMFADAEKDQQKPGELVNIKKPIVGFFGGIDDHTSDIDFVEKVVDLLPDMSFVFVGKVSSDCSRLRDRQNVCMLGQKPYQQIPYYGKCFNVAIMVWKQNRWIEACNPVKLKEYLALGKPIVSTPFPELQRYRDVVYQATTPQEFADRIKQALVEDNSERIMTRRKKVEHASWDSKAQLVLEELFDSAGDFRNTTMIRQRKKLRICLAASAGGHISQLLKIVEKWNEYETFCITTTEVMLNKLRQYGKVYIVGECNRQHPIRVALVLARCISVVFREKPDVVISTGAAAGCVVCFLGKLLGAKVIWVDSITNVDRISLSGRMVRYIADLFLVQWPQLAEKYSNVEYAGTLI